MFESNASILRVLIDSGGDYLSLYSEAEKACTFIYGRWENHLPRMYTQNILKRPLTELVRVCMFVLRAVLQQEVAFANVARLVELDNSDDALLTLKRSLDRLIIMCS